MAVSGLASSPKESDRVVKSAGRTMRIFEYLAEVRRPTTVAEIAAALGYPASSTTALLRSLVELGYLHFQPRGRTYCASSRLPLIGAWMSAPFFGEGAIMAMLRELGERSGETVFLAMPNGREMQIIQVSDGPSANLMVGTTRTKILCAAGHAALSELEDAEIVRLALRHNVETVEESRKVRHSELLETIRAARANGYAYAANLARPGGACIATLLPLVAGQSRLVACIAGPARRIDNRRDELIEILLDGVARYFGRSGHNVVSFAREADRAISRQLEPAAGSEIAATKN